MSDTRFKVNGKVKFDYSPGYKGVPEFGVYVLGQPTPSVEMLEEVICCVQGVIDQANGELEDDDDD